MLVVVLIVVIPFAIFIFADKNGAAKKKKAFQQIANDQNMKLSVADYWNNYCIGYDDQENNLLYINSNGPETKIQKIDLDEVRKCSINKVMKDYKNGDKHYSELTRLDLEFSFVSSQSPLTITLFDAEDRFSQNEEMVRAEKWLAFINKHKYNKDKIVAA